MVNTSTTNFFIILNFVLLVALSNIFCEIFRITKKSNSRNISLLAVTTVYTVIYVMDGKKIGIEFFEFILSAFLVAFVLYMMDKIKELFVSKPKEKNMDEEKVEATS